MSALTVLCVLVRGHVPFSVDYVLRLRSMAARHLPPHRFVCLTDQPNEMPDVDTVLIHAPATQYAWWTKVQLFNPELPIDGRLLYLDLDVLLVNDLRPIVEYPAPFALVPDGAPNFRPRNGLACVKRFNSSVMVWDKGTAQHLYHDWNTYVARRLWGDQDWIGEQCAEAAAMPAAWFPRLSEPQGLPPWAEETKVVLCKKPKNAHAVSVLPWFDAAWR